MYQVVSTNNQVALVYRQQLKTIAYFHIKYIQSLQTVVYSLTFLKVDCLAKHAVKTISRAL